MSSLIISNQVLPTAFFGRALVFLVAISLLLGISPISSGQALAPLTQPSSALEQYVRAPDRHYRFEVTDVEREPLLTRYTIRMQSQVWNPGGLVLGRRVWEHGIALVVPRLLITDTGLLFITGG